MNRCPRNLVSCDEPCQLGLLGVDSSWNDGCPWGINCASAHYCFFKYMLMNPNLSHTDKEIARLLDVSATTVKQYVTQALGKLSKDEGAEHLNILLGDVLRSVKTPEDEAIYDSERTEDKRLYSRHKGECEDHVAVHIGTGKPLLYGLSRNWYNHIDKKKFKQSGKK